MQISILGICSITGLFLRVIYAHGFDEENDLDIIPRRPEELVHTIVAPLDIEGSLKSSTVLTPRNVDLTKECDRGGDSLSHSVQGEGAGYFA